jgi:hypothetical protein
MVATTSSRFDLIFIIFPQSSGQPIVQADEALTRHPTTKKLLGYPEYFSRTGSNLTW